MAADAAAKVTAEHLRRAAYLYVRQSTLRQVVENTTSTDRQYALRERAVALGWPAEQVIVIDEDLGRSGASAQGRDGFQLLGLKGAMSEAELHLLKARLRGGQLAKARRGELAMPLPVGFVYDPAGRVVLDPDQGVQQAVRHLFSTFARTGSARATVKAFADQGLLFPLRVRTGPKRGELGWHPLAHHRVLQVLHNPRYAGAFTYGRRRARRGPDGQPRYLLQPRQDWIALIPDAHVGYLSWEQFEDNQRRLAACAAAHGQDRRAGPPREGPALLQGLVVCGRCGQRMTVRYQQRGHDLTPIYVCQRTGVQTATPSCQAILGGGVDHAVGELLLATISPMALEVALAVADELAARAEEADRLRRTQVERARHTAELARRRYLAVDPDNRLVAASLEADWNHALREHTRAQEDYEHQAAQTATLNAAQRAKVLALASDFPAMWSDPHTPQRERKRMVRLLLADVTLLRGQAITVHVRFTGGQTHSLTVPLPLAPQPLRDRLRHQPAVHCRDRLPHPPQPPARLPQRPPPSTRHDRRARPR